jgi:hypothetical protein
MKTKHTPGPWKFDYDRTIRQDKPGNCGSPITDKVYGKNNADQLANGHLLAAAPDMLNQLKVTFARLQNGQIDLIRDASEMSYFEELIAKAEGNE